MNSDLPALLDEWATSLFRELDYVREAQNGVRFKKLYGELEVLQGPFFCSMHECVDPPHDIQHGLTHIHTLSEI